MEKGRVKRRGEAREGERQRLSQTVLLAHHLSPQDAEAGESQIGGQFGLSF